MTERDHTPELGNFLRPLLIGALFLLTLTLGRLILLLTNQPLFAEMGAGALIRAFVHGLRFDLSITLLAAGLPLWLLALPTRWAGSRVWQGAWSAASYVVFLGCLWIAVADVVYFGLVSRHIGSELVLALTSDPGGVFRMPLDYPFLLGALVGLSAILVPVWRALPGPAVPAGGYGWTHWTIWVCLVPLFVVGGRGGLQGKPLNIVNAFQFGGVAEGYLTLNGPFSAFHSSRNTDARAPRNRFSDDEAAEIVRARFTLDGGERWVAPSYPLERRRMGAEPKGPRGTNVVILVLESWDALVTDSLRARAGLPTLGVTPNFDALVPEGRLLDRFYSSGQTSIEGMTAILASFPTIPGLPYLGRGMEQSRLSFMADLVGAEGYTSVFVRSAKRSSFRLDAIASLAGFDHYAGAEDILAGPSHTSVAPGYWGAWDFDSLRYLHERLIEAPEPFLGLFFGSSTHHPYPSPGEEWMKFPQDDRRHRFLNGVHYVDWALGRYLEMARDAGYFSRTLFVILADQTSPFNPRGDGPGRHWIPALLVGPGIPGGTTDHRVSSQMDIVPTVLDYLGSDVPHASFGESVLGPRRPAALLKSGEVLLRLDDRGWVVHDLLRRLGGEGPDRTQEELERALLAEVQLVRTLLNGNRVYSGR